MVSMRWQCQDDYKPSSFLGFLERAIPEQEAYSTSRKKLR